MTWAFGDVLNSFIASRQLSDFVVRVGFAQGDKVHLYATVSDDGVQFAPDAPRAVAK